MVSTSSKRVEESVGSTPTPIQRFGLLIVTAVVSVGLDQMTKLWAVRHLRAVRTQHVIRGVLDFRFSLNEGAAWSFLADAEPTFRRWFFLITTVAALIMIATLYRRARMDQRALRWALAMLFGGAIGNLIDRVRSGQVVDFISVQFIHWPTFNVADIAITIGLLLLGLDLLQSRKKALVADTPAVVEPSRGTRRKRGRR